MSQRLQAQMELHCLLHALAPRLDTEMLDAIATDVETLRLLASDSGARAAIQATYALYPAALAPPMDAMYAMMHGWNGACVTEFVARSAADKSTRRDWSKEETAVLESTHEKLGNNWIEIAKLLPGRTPNAVRAAGG